MYIHQLSIDFIYKCKWQLPTELPSIKTGHQRSLPMHVDITLTQQREETLVEELRLAFLGC